MNKNVIKEQLYYKMLVIVNNFRRISFLNLFKCVYSLLSKKKYLNEFNILICPIYLLQFSPFLIFRLLQLIDENL